ncbi:MAG: putative glycoside hydrolase [bacterium]|nr:putative glycoside hydrolase [bacterium]
MKKITLLATIFIAAMLHISLTFKTLRPEKQYMGVLWYLPTMTDAQAIGLAPYDFIVLDYENFINNPRVIDAMLKLNAELQLYVYLNQTEIFDPMFPDKPWSIKLLAELKKKPQWWIKQPDGKNIGAWKGMKALDMRSDSPKYDGKNYHEWIASKYLEILDDPRINGCLVDNAWGDDSVGISWLATYRGNRGFDFDANGKPDRNYKEINKTWTSGMRTYLQTIRKAKGKDFFIITNPGNLSYIKETDCKQLEDFPYEYHNLGGRSDLRTNLSIASNFKFAIVNPRTEDYFYGACSARLRDNLFLCVGQNTMYDKKFDLKLGKPKGIAKIEKGFISRAFENGTVFVSLTEKKSHIEYKDGTKRTK